MDDAFEWDAHKAASNLLKHGVTFDQAVDALDDPAALAIVDMRAAYGEARVILIGQVAATILVFVDTERGAKTQIISTKGE